MREDEGEASEPAGGRVVWGLFGYAAVSILLVPAGLRFLLPAAASYANVAVLVLVVLVNVVWLLSFGVIGVYTLAGPR
jgi:hypothetical protein